MRKYYFGKGTKMKTSTILLSTAAVVLALGFIGCKKKESPAAPAAETTMKDMQMQTAKTAEDTKKAATTAAASVEQTTCPVMDGNKISKNVFVEYKGKKVYFCCEDCKGKFLAEPEKYIAKLPQFAK
jgi:YHS domain-containing protein